MKTTLPRRGTLIRPMCEFLRSRARRTFIIHHSSFIIRRFRHPPSAIRLRVLAACLVSLLLCGCPQANPDAANAEKKLPFAGVKLKLQVVGDPEMAKAIERLRGDWSTQSGSDFEIVQAGEQELSAAESLSADAVICSSRLLGVLGEKKLLADAPENIQKSASWAEEFELPKIREAAWAGRIYGLPFGSPVFTIYYRADLLKKMGRTPPKTWPEYQELAKLLAAEKTSTADAPWYGTLEPLARLGRIDAARPRGAVCQASRQLRDVVRRENDEALDRRSAGGAGARRSSSRRQS